MPTIRNCLIVALAGLIAGCASSPATPDDPGLLQERMTEKQFRAAGLNRLEPHELRALNNWLRFGSVAEKPRAAGTARTEDWDAARKNPVTGFGLTPEPPQSAELEQIRVQIDGTFDGWGSATVFRFKNGQVWKQCGGYNGGRFAISPMEDPMAVIERSLVSGFRLSIDGYNRETKVCRIE